MTDPTAPVTPRTEAMHRLRDHLAILRGRAVRQWMDGPAEYDVREIDAAIAASDAIEREAGGTDALRAALERLVAEYDDDPIRPASWISMKQARAALAASDAGPAGIDWPLVFKAFANAVGLGIVQESQNAIAAEYARLSVLPTSDSESDDKP
jgi:hypothetical protein